MSEVTEIAGENIRELNEEEMTALRRIAEDKFLCAMYIGHIVWSGIEKSGTVDSYVALDDQSKTKQAATLGAHWMAGFIKAVQEDEWPTNMTPACDFYDWLVEWAATEEQSSFRVNDQTVRTYLNLPESVHG